MKYLKTFAGVFAVGGLALVGIALTSSSAGAAGQRSAGIVMMLCGVAAVWIVLELIAIGKNAPEPTEPPGK